MKEYFVCNAVKDMPSNLQIYLHKENQYLFINERNGDTECVECTNNILYDIRATVTALFAAVMVCVAIKD